jgi:hypothetical protein
MILMTNFLADFQTQLMAKLGKLTNDRASASSTAHSSTRLALLAGAVLFAGFFAFMALVQFSTPDMPDNDGYYHIKLAYLMRTQSLKPEFPWLPLTILNPREFYDHHFLFHIALIPFTFGDLISGAKWASVVFASLSFLSVWWLLYTQKVPFSWLWALGLLAVSEAFIYRMSITRAQSLSLAVLAFGLTLMFSGKHKWLLPLAFVYVWLYDAFPLLLVLAGIYVFSVWSIEGRFNGLPLIYAGAGVVLGLLVNPYFPHNILFAIQHILPKLSEATSVSVGNEWYPYTTGQLIRNSPLGLISFVGAILALGLTGRKMSLQTAVSFFAAIMFGLMLFQARRFIEYFPAFALIFAAFAWTDYIKDRQQEPSPVNQRLRKAKPLNGLRAWTPVIILSLILLPGIWMTSQESQASITRAKPRELFEGASGWLENNTPPGSRVFQTDWDDFPRLFFYNSQNTYLVGLDPTYMQLYNADLYETWVDITNGRISKPSSTIVDRFGAYYVVTDLNHSGFLREAEEDPGLIEVYRDDLTAVFEIR